MSSNFTTKWVAICQHADSFNTKGEGFGNNFSNLKLPFPSLHKVKYGRSHYKFTCHTNTLGLQCTYVHCTLEVPSAGRG